MKTSTADAMLVVDCFRSTDGGFRLPTAKLGIPDAVFVAVAKIAAERVAFLRSGVAGEKAADWADQAAGWAGDRGRHHIKGYRCWAAIDAAANALGACAAWHAGGYTGAENEETDRAFVGAREACFRAMNLEICEQVQRG